MRDIGHIYLIKASGTDRYKIGLTTRSVADRLKELNSSQSAYPLLLQHSIKVSDVKAVEKSLHQEFKAYRVHGEWFEFTNDELWRVRLRLDEISRHQNQSFNSPSQAKPLHISQRALPRLEMPFKVWITPILLATGLGMLVSQCEFFYSPNQSNSNVSHTSKPFK